MKFNLESSMNKLKSMSRKRLLIGSGIGVIVVLIIFRNLTSGGGQGTASLGPPIKVQIETVRPQVVEQTITAAGRIQPVVETEISSTISGQIIDLRVEEGEAVLPGDTLVILDRLRYIAAEERSRSALRSAQASLKQVEAQLARGRQLFEKDLNSLMDMELLEANYEGALSRMEQAEATLAQSQDDLAKTILVALEPGIVTKLNKEVGEMALGSTFQADILLVISDLSMMEVLVEVDETDVVDIEILDPVEIEVDAIQGVIFPGRVSRVAHSANIQGAGTQNQVTSFEVVVTLDINPESRRLDSRIRPGMSATSTITTARHDNTLAIPIQALAARAPISAPAVEIEGEIITTGRRGGGGFQRGGGGPPGGGNSGFQRRGEETVEVVFVVVPTEGAPSSGGGFLTRLFGKQAVERVEQREVGLGISSDTHYEIISGLEEGEEIIIGNYRAVSRELQDGSLVVRPQGSEFDGQGIQRN